MGKCAHGKFLLFPDGRRPVRSMTRIAEDFYRQSEYSCYLLNDSKVTGRRKVVEALLPILNWEGKTTDLRVVSEIHSGTVVPASVSPDFFLDRI
jgi:hypothetical protein